MDPIISLPFSESAVLQELEKYLSKKRGYSLLIPSSRQQKGFDLVILNCNNKKSLLIQVKGSRTYIPKPPKRESTKRFINYTWFNTFKVKPGSSDFYVLFGLYVNVADGDMISTRIKNKNWYDFVTLLFNESEMIAFIDNLKQKRSNNPDTMFGFGFDNLKEIILTRGAKSQVDYSSYLLKNRIGIIENALK